MNERRIQDKNTYITTGVQQKTKVCDSSVQIWNIPSLGKPEDSLQRTFFRGEKHLFWKAGARKVIWMHELWKIMLFEKKPWIYRVFLKSAR